MDNLKYKGILEDKEKDTSSVKAINNSSVDNFSKFLCIANKPLYFIGLILSLSLMLLMVHTININFYFIYVFGATCFITTTIISYLVGKRAKIKKDTLELHKVNIFKKIVFFSVTFFIGIVVSIVMAITIVYKDKDKYIINNGDYSEIMRQEMAEQDKNSNS